MKVQNSLKIKERKYGKLRFKINKIFPQKYNLKISPSVQLNENIYITRIFLKKLNFGKGNYFDIIVKNGNY